MEMTKFMVEGSYNIPEWFDVELEADSKEEAEKEALRNIEMSYPEAIDVEVDLVREVKDNN